MTGPYTVANEAIFYQFSHSQKSVGQIGDQYAVMFDRENGALLSWGEADIVKSNFDYTVSKLMSVSPNMAEALELITFVASYDTIEELNACIAISGRVLKFQSFLEGMPSMIVGAQLH